MDDYSILEHLAPELKQDLEHHSPIAATEIQDDQLTVDDTATTSRPKHMSNYERLTDLTEDEKKERLRYQNKIAAEKARSKKRQEQAALSTTVADLHAENARLRERLAQLRAAKQGIFPAGAVSVSASASYATAHPPEPVPSTLDIAAALDPSLNETAFPNISSPFLSRLQTELAASKAALLDKQLQLARLKDESSAPAPELDAQRHTLLGSHVRLDNVRAEAEAIRSVVANLQTERKELEKQRAMLGRQAADAGLAHLLDRSEAMESGTAEDAEHPAQDGGTAVAPLFDDAMGEAGSQDQALQDIRGWVDAQSWENTGLAAS